MLSFFFAANLFDFMHSRTVDNYDQEKCYSFVSTGVHLNRSVSIFLRGARSETHPVILSTPNYNRGAPLTLQHVMLGKQIFWTPSEKSLRRVGAACYLPIAKASRSQATRSILLKNSIPICLEHEPCLRVVYHRSLEHLPRARCANE